jgi:SAM-dependent methyltransferase
MSHYSNKQYPPREDFDKFYYHLFFKQGDKILDIGCSTGNFVAQDSKNIIGIDIDKDAIKIARERGLNVSEHDLTKKIPFKSNMVENINCKHVLEHLEDPLFLMKEIFRILKKNGKLILLTDKLTKHFWDDYTHKRPFTEKSLEQLAYDAGFRKYEVYPFPSRGIFGMGFLYNRGVISRKFAKKIYKFFGKIFKQSGILLEATK